MKKILGGVAGLLLSLPTLASATVYDIDGYHSSVGFSVRHMMVSNVHGNFKTFSGTVDIDDKKLENSKVNVKIDPASINTGIDQRDTHLKSPDFFDTAKFPDMTFVSKKVKSEGKGKLSLVGDLTMHGVTKEVTLAVSDLTEKDVKMPAMGPNMPETFHRGATATGKLSRKDFGLAWGKALETGGVVVGDEITIDIELELVKHVDAPAAAPATK